MSKDKITSEKIYNLEVRFVNKDKSNCFKYPHRMKFYENDGCSADIVMPDIWFEHKDLDKYVSDLEAKLAEKEKEIEEYKRICTIAHVEDLQIENMLLKGKEQDKISFCVERLENVRFEIDNKTTLSGQTLLYTKVMGIIDNQIKQLKGK